MASSSRKRTLDISEIEEPTEAATVTGVVTELSPIKVSKNNSHIKYFSGQVSDGKKTCRVVSFEPGLRNKLEKSRLERSAVSIVNCQIKERSFNKGLEIMASNRSSVEPATSKSFELPPSTVDENIAVAVEVNECESLSINQRVTVVVKVLGTKEPTSVQTKAGKKLEKQDCTIGDASGCIRLVLWETNVGKLQLGSSYRLENVTVRDYCMKRYLSFSEDAVIRDVDDIGETETIDGSEDEQAPDANVFDGEIVAVVQCDSYLSCVSCRGKVKSVNDVIGECGKCSIKQKLSKCKQKDTAKIILETAKEQRKIMLFQEHLQAITANAAGDTIAEKLLSTERVRITINKNDVAITATLL